MQLEIEDLPAGGGLRLTGEVDLSTAEDLAKAIDALMGSAPPGDLTIDLSGVTFMDSTGLRVIITVAHQLEGRGKLVLTAPGPMVMRLFELTGVAHLANLQLLERGQPAPDPA